MSRLGHLDHVGDGPTDRLTHIAETMAHALYEHPQAEEGDRVIIFVTSSDRGGAAIVGYDDSVEILADLLRHMQLTTEALGKRIDIVFLDDEGVHSFEGGSDEQG